MITQGFNETELRKKILQKNGLFGLMREINKNIKSSIPEESEEIYKKLSGQLSADCTFLSIMEKKDEKAEECLEALEECLDSPGILKKIRDEIYSLPMCCSRFFLLEDKLRKEASVSENIRLRVFLLAMADYVGEIWG